MLLANYCEHHDLDPHLCQLFADNKPLSTETLVRQVLSKCFSFRFVVWRLVQAVVHKLRLLQVKRTAPTMCEVDIVATASLGFFIVHSFDDEIARRFFMSFTAGHVPALAAAFPSWLLQQDMADPARLQQLLAANSSEPLPFTTSLMQRGKQSELVASVCSSASPLRTLVLFIVHVKNAVLGFPLSAWLPGRIEEQLCKQASTVQDDCNHCSPVQEADAPATTQAICTLQMLLLMIKLGTAITLNGRPGTPSCGRGVLFWQVLVKFIAHSMKAMQAHLNIIQDQPILEGVNPDGPQLELLLKSTAKLVLPCIARATKIKMSGETASALQHSRPGVLPDHMLNSLRVRQQQADIVLNAAISPLQSLLTLVCRPSRLAVADVLFKSGKKSITPCGHVKHLSVSAERDSCVRILIRPKLDACSLDVWLSAIMQQACKPCLCFTHALTMTHHAAHVMGIACYCRCSPCSVEGYELGLPFERCSLFCFDCHGQRGRAQACCSGSHARHCACVPYVGASPCSCSRLIQGRRRYV